MLKIEPELTNHTNSNIFLQLIIIDQIRHMQAHISQLGALQRIPQSF